MTQQDILDIGIKNGRFINLHVRSSKVKGPRNNKRTVIKDYFVNARYGVYYSNMKGVKRQDTVNTEGERKSLWFKHTSHKGFVVSREDDSRMYLQVVNPKISKVTYWENDAPISEDKLVEEGFLKLSDKEIRPILILYLDNIESISYDSKVFKGATI